VLLAADNNRAATGVVVPHLAVAPPRGAIARTLANGPHSLLLDEPFGALDRQTGELMQALRLEIREAERKPVARLQPARRPLLPVAAALQRGSHRGTRRLESVAPFLLSTIAQFIHDFAKVGFAHTAFGHTHDVGT